MKVRLYHGTGSNFDKLTMTGMNKTQIDADREGCVCYERGISFSTSKEVAKRWALIRVREDSGDAARVLTYDIEIDDSIRFGDAGEYCQEMYERMPHLMDVEAYDIIKVPEEVEPHVEAFFDMILSCVGEPAEIIKANAKELAEMDRSNDYGVFDDRDDKSKKLELVTGVYEYIIRNQETLDKLMFIQSEEVEE